MIRATLRIRDRNQVTLPAEVVTHLKLEPGDWLELTLSESGRMLLRPARLVTAGTAEAELLEQASLASVRSKRYTEFDSLDDFEKHVDALEEKDAFVRTPRAAEEVQITLSEKQRQKVLAAVAAALQDDSAAYSSE